MEFLDFLQLNLAKHRETSRPAFAIRAASRIDHLESDPSRVSPGEGLLIHTGNIFVVQPDWRVARAGVRMKPDK